MMDFSGDEVCAKEMRNQTMQQNVNSKAIFIRDLSFLLFHSTFLQEILVELSLEWDVMSCLFHFLGPFLPLMVSLKQEIRSLTAQNK